MEKYSENPNLRLEIVTTVNNEKEYRIHCRKIKGQFYVMNKDCFRINNKWYRKDSGLIVKDHELNKWFLVSEKSKGATVIDSGNGVSSSVIIIDDNGNLKLLNRYIIGCNNDKKPVYGFASENRYNNVNVKPLTGGIFCALNAEVLQGGNFMEKISEGIFYEYPPDKINDYKDHCLDLKNIIDHRNQGYNIEDNHEEYQDKVDYFNKLKVPFSKNVLQASKFLENLTFGIEIETSKGFLRKDLQYKTGVVVCRDGSLHGGAEYTSIPLTGAKGLQNILDLTSVLKPRHKFDHFCSYHIHFGNIELSRPYLLALYRLSYMIQNDLFKMFPIYKSDYRLAEKNRDYNQKLKSFNIGNFNGSSKEEYDSYIKNNFNTLFVFLTEGSLPSKRFNRKNKVHPQSQKWNRNSRYYWINFMNAVFSNRNTIEFRLHHGTMNETKAINWLFICASILLYAQKNINRLLVSDKQVTIFDVLDYFSIHGSEGTRLSNYLKEYYKSRVQFFTKNRTDRTGLCDIVNDDYYTFTDSTGYKFIF